MLYNRSTRFGQADGSNEGQCQSQDADRRPGDLENCTPEAFQTRAPSVQEDMGR